MSASPQQPIFFDPKKRRWPKIRNSAIVAIQVFLLLAIMLVTGILVNPHLSTIQLPKLSTIGFHQPSTPTSRLSALKTDPHYQKVRAALLRNLGVTTSHTAQTATSTSSRVAAADYQSIGFFVNWDDSSFTSLKTNISHLDVVVGEWLHLEDATGTLAIDNSAREQQAVDFIRSHNAQTHIFELVNNFTDQSWLSDELVQALSSPAGRANIIQQSIEHAKTHGYDGISIDFENIPDGKQALLTTFIEQLVPLAHAAGLQVTVNVPADDTGFEYSKLANVSDAVIVMAYDEHWSSGQPGPIASQNWFLNVIEQRVKDIPPSKLIVAIGNYGYDWAPKKNAQELTFEDALMTAKESEGDINLEDTSMNPTFDYADETNQVHHVWMLDGVTAFNELASLTGVKPQGVALWRLGSEDPSIWKVFGTTTTFQENAAKTLQTITYGYDIDYEGQGEILKLAATPSPGQRSIVFDADQGLITTEEYTTFPSAYVINRYGAKNKTIALTFDDGPDPTYTPAILDILKREQVHATFFVVGMNAEHSPEILERIADEGNEIGNHTFTHPNLTDLSSRGMELELSTNQRLIESLTGRQTLLFRPPFAEDIEPETPDQTQTLNTASRLGYITIGIKIDPNDWRNPGTDTIVQRVIDQADAGAGNVVLLHDSGGDRSQTVAALPKLIEGLKQRGYAIVLVSDLMDKSRDAVMPPVPASDQVQAAFGGVSYRLIAWFLLCIGSLGFFGIVLGIFRSLMISLLALIQKRRDAKFTPSSESVNLSVAVIVPAYNEERVVERTVASLLAGEHPTRFEIVVVDDGSTDATVARLQESYGQHPQVHIFAKENGGKPAALNFGIAQTDAEIIICLDADTIFARDCIMRLVERFVDPSIGAVAGNAKVGNRINMITRLQALEYITSQNLDRRAFSLLNCMTVVPGAVGAWRRALVVRAGGFSHRTLAEDADLTILIRTLGYRAAYADTAIALTEAPDTINGFIKQRYRWMYGTLQATWVHREILFRPRYGALGFIALPSVFLFQILFPLISPIMDALVVVTMIWSGIDWYMHPLSFSSANLRVTLLAFLLFTVLDAASAVLAFCIEQPREDWRLLTSIIWQRLVYRQLMYYIAIRSLIASLRGNAVGWNKLERKGTVSDQSV